ncbi:MAG: phosphoribosylformylglycinamidine cyclo-ligase [Nitrospirae bacterium]|nr:phosphoribosylformylglycinamidine cyclo-ligase [Nitrospirota bacterium]
MTYKTSGVDISRGNKLVDIIKPIAHSTFRRGVLQDIGSFGAFFKLPLFKYKKPVLVSGTDGVGTKLKIAFMIEKHDTVGIDLVAMCVNDVLTSGAEPLFFLDYFATGKLSIRKAQDVIKGIAEGCKIAGCSLIGGETAEMPGFYKNNEYDLAGFSVGIIEEDKIIDGSNIKSGDVIIGLASSGLHSNGYSLVRKVFFDIKKYKTNKLIPELGCTIGEELLKPTRIYVKSILGLQKSVKIKGMAHVTGGGITENLPRILPRGLRAVIKNDSWYVRPIFDIVQTMGKVSDKEMFRTFNMGVGFIIVVKKSDVGSIIKKLKQFGEKVFVIGYIEKGHNGVVYT